MELISQEFIKPVSPTPDHLKFYEYSILDQLIGPSLYTPVLLYYPSPPDNNNNKKPEAINTSRLKHLKKSLSQILAHYYPLAGRLRNDNTGVDCNDEGVPFLEAFVHNHRLQDILDGKRVVTESLVPLTNYESVFPSNTLLLVQVTLFECGGMAVGISATHKILDARSLITFLTDWAALTRQDDPNFTLTQLVPLSKIIPPANGLPPSIPVEGFISTEPCVRNIFVFRPCSIADLKIKAASENILRPSRVEVVTSTIWMCLMENSKRPCLITHMVNLRKRVDPPMHDHHLGNFIGMVVAHNDENHIANMVASLRKGISEFEKKCLKGEREALGASIVNHATESINYLVSRKDADLYKFNSWCGFPFYDVDFGWGKPVLSSTAEGKSKNSIKLIDTKDGGVEALVCLSEEDMKVFEKNTELLTYATLKPNSHV
uniref:Acylsugar acyltransferase 5 n=1 Tax=Salpiglossis sinuata TaxID=33121 RepID=A0A1Y0B7G9_9SOLA|nr:acylsugar acyltransferase 5 [Salpiglossis sinuata]